MCNLVATIARKWSNPRSAVTQIRILTRIPLRSASLFRSTLEMKNPVPNSLPPRTVKPNDGLVSGVTKMRRACGRMRRSMRRRVLATVAAAAEEGMLMAHQEEVVASVIASLEELAVEP